MMNLELVLSITDKISPTLQKVIALTDNAGKAFDQIGTKAQKFNEINLNLQNTAQQLQGMIAPGIAFERQMAEVSAMTGVTDAQLKQIDNSAKSLSTTFGIDASKSAETFQNILSKLSPEIAKNPPALEAMGRSALLLSKTMKNDLSGATQTLTSVMNAYGVDLSNPIEASKKMAIASDLIVKSALVGSAEVPDVAKAIEGLGGTAKNAGVSLAESLAVLQTLDQKGFKRATEGGIAFRNVLTELGQGRFMDKASRESLQAAGVDINKLANASIPFVDRLSELKKIQLDSALVAKFFGKENLVAGQALLDNISVVKQFTTDIQKAGGATETYASKIMNTEAERLERVKVRWQLLGIQLYESIKPYLPMIQTVGTLTMALGNLMPLLTMLGGAVWWLGTRLLASSLSVLGFAISLTVQGAAAIGSFLIKLITLNTGLLVNMAYWAISGILALEYGAKLIWTGGVAVVSFVRNLLLGKIALADMAFMTLLNARNAISMAGSFLFASGTALVGFISSIGTATLAQLGLNTAMYANPIGAVILGLLAIGTAVYLVIQNWDTVKGWLWGVAQFFMQMNPFYWLWQGINALFPSLQKTLVGWWNALTGWLDGLFQKAKSFFNWITGSAETLKSAEKNQLPAGIDKVQKIEQKEVDKMMLDILGKKPEGNTPFGLLPNGLNDKKTKSLSNGNSVEGDNKQIKNLTVNITNLVQGMNIVADSFSEATAKIKDEVAKALIDAVRDVEIMGG